MDFVMRVLAQMVTTVPVPLMTSAHANNMIKASVLLATKALIIQVAKNATKDNVFMGIMVHAF